MSRLHDDEEEDNTEKRKKTKVIDEEVKKPKDKKAKSSKEKDNVVTKSSSQTTKENSTSDVATLTEKDASEESIPQHSDDSASNEEDGEEEESDAESDNEEDLAAQESEDEATKAGENIAKMALDPPPKHESLGETKDDEIEKANRTIFIGNLPSSLITSKVYYCSSPFFHCLKLMNNRLNTKPSNKSSNPAVSLNPSASALLPSQTSSLEKLPLSPKPSTPNKQP